MIITTDSKYHGEMGSGPTLPWPGIDDPSDGGVDCSLEPGQHLFIDPYGKYFMACVLLPGVYLVIKFVYKADTMSSLGTFTVQELCDKAIAISVEYYGGKNTEEWGQGQAEHSKSGRLTPIFAWLEKFQGLEFITQAKCRRAPVSRDPITECIAQGHLRDPMATILTSVWDQLTPGPLLFLSQRAARFKPT